MMRQSNTQNRGYFGRAVRLAITAIAFSGSVAFASEPVVDQTATPGGESSFGFGAETVVSSSYLWHGMIVTDEPVVQPQAWVRAAEFTLSVWGNRNAGYGATNETTDELDYYLTHEREWSAFSTELSLAYYTYPGQDEAPSTGEAAFALSVPLGLLTVGARQSLDVLEYPGASWGEVSLSATRSITSFLECEAVTSLGWASTEFNEAYLGVPRSALNGLSASLDLSVYFSEAVYWRPRVEVFRALDSEITSATQRTAWNFGAALGMDF